MEEKIIVGKDTSLQEATIQEERPRETPQLGAQLSRTVPKLKH